ncbi:MAG: hypothetical protein ABSH03_16320 [Candidatus Lustribacter sp.]
MFNELTKLFGGQRKERRHSPRKKARFNISWVKNGNELIPGVGMEMSLNGLLMATKTPPGVPDFDIIMEIGGRKIRTRLHTARSGSIIRENQQWTVIGATYSGIAADDYDAIVRFCKDMPMEVHNRAAAELAAMDKSDDAYRMLPMRVQQHVLDALIRLGRLDMPQPNQQPLLRMSSLGIQAGKHRLAVHSRIAGGHGSDPQQFDSVIVIDDSGTVKVES